MACEMIMCNDEMAVIMTLMAIIDKCGNIND